MPERQLCEALGRCVALWVDELEFIAGGEDQRRLGLGTHAGPVESRRRRLRAVGLHGDLEANRVQLGDRLTVQLQERLPTRADDVGAPAALRRPVRGHRGRQFARGAEAPAVGSYTNKVGIAESAGGTRAVRLSPGPEVAAGESAEDGWATRLHALSL